MVRGFSRLILPPDFSRLFFPALWCGGRAMRVKGQRSCEGGVSFWGNESPWTWAKNDSLGPRAARGEGARGHAPFLEASRRSWKGGGGGAMNREERGVGTEGYKGTQDARSSCALVVSSSSWWFGLG